ncbi:protein DELETION OF SUV3 SUPPRESSOR 1(I)-like [Lycium barbarum]|uniref:protein DELETION OF SUV3 SUPPRESSOR 1(I)-like n=1 Tax=Lycium barbarum TaxID=112863 RepID=UPI00293E7DA1|nr:protein DELETION OF SUV3 SUPPRESSOR 1(I)-like [Lycium barbarum]
MAIEQPKPTAEDVKMDQFEDDDEFEEFAIDQEWEDKEEGKEVTQQGEDDWDDDDVNDDFSLQLRKELEATLRRNELHLHMNSFSSQNWTMLFLLWVQMFPYVCTLYFTDKT